MAERFQKPEKKKKKGGFFGGKKRPDLLEDFIQNPQFDINKGIEEAHRENILEDWRNETPSQPKPEKPNEEGPLW